MVFFFCRCFCQVEVVPLSPIILWDYEFYLNLPFWLTLSDTTLALDGGGWYHVTIRWRRSLACCHLRGRGFFLLQRWNWGFWLHTQSLLTLWQEWSHYHWVIVEVLFAWGLLQIDSSFSEVVRVPAAWERKFQSFMWSPVTPKERERSCYWDESPRFLFGLIWHHCGDGIEAPQAPYYCHLRVEILAPPLAFASMSWGRVTVFPGVFGWNRAIIV